MYEIREEGDFPPFWVFRVPAGTPFTESGLFLAPLLLCRSYNSILAPENGEDIRASVYGPFATQITLVGKEKYLDGVKHMEEIISGEEFCELHVLDMFCAHWTSRLCVDCEIGLDGAKYLKEMLMSKPLKYLQELNLSGNALTDDGFICLVEALSAGCCPDLLYLSIDGSGRASVLTSRQQNHFQILGCAKAVGCVEGVSQVGGCLSESSVQSYGVSPRERFARGRRQALRRDPLTVSRALVPHQLEWWVLSILIIR